MKYTFRSKKILADYITPVALFMRVRDYYPEVVMLESSDYMSKENSHSFICCDTLETLLIDGNGIRINNETVENISAVEAMERFMAGIEFADTLSKKKFNGIFGYTNYDSVQQFENIKFEKRSYPDVPLLRYDFFRYIFAFDHFYSELYLIENLPDGEESQLDKMEIVLNRTDRMNFDFKLQGDERSTTTEADFKAMVTKAKSHCQRGDVFQLVLSRRFEQDFEGDEFNVYRKLRSINPSPYLFYFDYGTYKIFGSSPEAQLKVEEGIAEIHPIAGTFRRTGDVDRDNQLATDLGNDPKETSEHVMLVDLARNDLSRNTKNVKVAEYKEVQFFSHVIHLVSVVKGELDKSKKAFQIYADTFPAGTLSGAPKYKAMELIDKYEPHGRAFYGGGIGMINFNGDLNHAIVIRSFMSKGGTLYYQAGAGIVIGSDEAKELQEVNNKLAALKKALLAAQKI